MSVGFKSSYQDVIESFEDGDDELFEEAVNEMLMMYGPVIITDANLGGSLGISMRYDSLKVENKYTVGGKASGKLELGALTVGASADVKYSRSGLDIWKEIHHSIDCTGGSQEAVRELTSLLKQNEPDPEAVNAAMTMWVESICSLADNQKDANSVTIDGRDGTKKDNTALVSFDYKPIWTIFPLSVSKKMKPIVINCYKGKKILVDLSHFGITGMED